VVAFRGWPVEAVEFYEGLRADNSKAYWTAHKAVYEDLVRAPLVELLGELGDEFGAMWVARPYRDVRFSTDKTPYKTACYGTLEHGGYVRFSADGLTAGFGCYQMSPDQLTRFRSAVAGDISGGELVRIVADLAAVKIEVGGGAVLKTAPRGYPRDHPRVELLRYRSLIGWRAWPVGAWLGTARARSRVIEVLRAGRPMLAWLAQHVGPGADQH
jgi:uncharacterized protein (TIGR02453 family)